MAIQLIIKKHLMLKLYLNKYYDIMKATRQVILFIIGVNFPLDLSKESNNNYFSIELNNLSYSAIILDQSNT